MSGRPLLVSSQQTPLRGTIAVPGDKSISHRALILGAVADGVSYVRNWLPAGDTLATLSVMRALGVPIEVDEAAPFAWNLRIEGQGIKGLQPPPEWLDCRNAGTAIRLLAGLLAGQSFPTVLDGSEQLRKRPMRRIIEPLGEMGARIHGEDARAPLQISPALLHGISYRMPVASAQVKSAILLAGLYAAGETRVFQPGPARDHTERMLAAMGVPILADGAWVTLPAERPDELLPLDLTVPGDISSAAFPLVAAAIVPHSEIVLANIGANETRTGLLDILRQMGAQIAVENERETGGEPAVDLRVCFDELHAATIAGDMVVRGIDEFPVLAVAASQAAGRSLVSDASELRVKEVDRISVLSGELRKLGVPIEEMADGFAIDGPVRPLGATVDCHDDHRLAMALAVCGLIAAGETCVLDAQCAHDSFPGFVEAMQRLGATMRWGS
ncbi:MAG: 3-phosphoshikimate 1-carboxyvinyltransferase [Candidatus Promineifilaceae bacterium]